jgi:hypothetical protein
MYDGISDFATEETVYVGKFDEPVGFSGLERVEINLLNAGRIPSNEIKLGKAKKTVVEYDDQVITYDEVKSWVNITGLTLSKLYRFKIYNIDEFGNKSVPVEIAVIPYTRDELNSLVLPAPLLTISPTAAEFVWINGLATGFYDFANIQYTYTDADGEQTGKTTNNSFAIGNLRPGVPIDVKIKCMVIPKIVDVNIIDTVPLETTITITPSTPEEYLATRTNRLVKEAYIAGNTGKVTWGAVSEHLVFSEIRYKTTGGSTNTFRSLTTDTELECPNVALNERFETRSAFVPTAAVDTFYSEWKTSNVPFLTLLTGSYKVDPSSRRGPADYSAEFAQVNKVTITAVEAGQYRISDLLGGFYVPGRTPNLGMEGYNENDHVCPGTFSFDGVNIGLIDFKMDSWGTGFKKVEGNWNMVSKTLNLSVYWGDYTFYLVLIKE